MVAPPLPAGGFVRIVLMGDVMTGRGIDRAMRWPLPAAHPEVSPREARRHLREAERRHGPIPPRVPPEYIWGDALDMLASADARIRLFNLATTITSATTAWPGKAANLRMNPRHAACLSAAGLTGCSLANDHALDWDYPGLRETLATLGGAGIASAGAGIDAAAAHAPAVFDLGAHHRLLLFAWAAAGADVPAGWGAAPSRPGIALLPGLGAADLAEVAACVHRHRRPGDLVVVSLHWGGRAARHATEAQRTFTHRLVDDGVVDVVHGHGARLPLAPELHRGRLLLHGCGDLINDEEAAPAVPGARPDVGCLWVATLALRDGRLVTLEALPLRRRRFRLERAGPDERSWLAARLAPAGAPAGAWHETAAGPAWVIPGAA